MAVAMMAVAWRQGQLLRWQWRGDDGSDGNGAGGGDCGSGGNKYELIHDLN
jgi:hypothetical protein